MRFIVYHIIQVKVVYQHRLLNINLPQGKDISLLFRSSGRCVFLQCVWYTHTHTLYLHTQIGVLGPTAIIPQPTYNDNYEPL